MIKIILKITGFLVLITIAVVVGQIILVPFFVSNPFFSKFEIFKNLKREIIVNPIEQVFIRENDGLKGAIEDVQNSVFVVSPNKESAYCGFSLTSDGLIISPLFSVPSNQNFIFLNDKKVNFRILKQDSKNNLILLKVEEGNLKTTSFADLTKLVPGERVFLIGIEKTESKPRRIVNEGIIRTLNGNLFETNILEKTSLQRCPLFNLEGEFVGLSSINKNGELFVIPTLKIREFAGI